MNADLCRRRRRQRVETAASGDDAIVPASSPHRARSEPGILLPQARSAAAGGGSGRAQIIARAGQRSIGGPCPASRRRRNRAHHLESAAPSAGGGSGGVVPRRKKRSVAAAAKEIWPRGKRREGAGHLGTVDRLKGTDRPTSDGSCSWRAVVERNQCGSIGRGRDYTGRLAPRRICPEQCGTCVRSPVLSVSLAKMYAYRLWRACSAGRYRFLVVDVMPL